MSSSHCDVIIPFYNERGRIEHVLAVVTRTRLFGRIVCVDDGSTDGGAESVRGKFPQVTLVQLSTNSGKTAAVTEGLKYIQSTHVLLLDADLKAMRAKELEEAVTIFEQQTDLAMLILRRIENTVVQVLQADVLFSGERLIRKTDLEAALASQSVERYQLEIAINTYMFERGLKVRWFPVSHQHTYKVSKVGIVKGVFNFFRMVIEMMSFGGLWHFIRHLFTSPIERVRLRPT